MSSLCIKTLLYGFKIQMRLQKRLWPNCDAFADSDAGDGRQYPVGSLIVRPGCTFYQFHETHYNGGWNVYEGEFNLKVNSVQEACAKCFAVHLLKFEILQTR